MSAQVQTLAELSQIHTPTEFEIGPVLILAIREREARVSKRRFRSVRDRDNTSALNLNSYVQSSQIYTHLETLSEKMIIDARGRWNPDYPSIELKDFAVREDISLSVFVDIHLKQQVTKQLENLIESINDAYCQALLTQVFACSDRKDRFLSYPASRSHHHAYPSGLVVHTFEVVEHCDKMRMINTEIKRDWLIVCAILHDIGKIYVYDGAGELTEEGKLKGHVILGYELLTRLMDEIEDFPKKFQQELEHSIVSHMGKEGKYGSYANPSTPIALLVHKMDELSTELARL